jgi:TonB dependent receptor.
VDGNFNRDRDILNAWSPSNTSSDIPRLSKNDPNSNFSRPSDWYLEDASYLRLKNVTISYDLSQMLQKWSSLKDRGSRMSVYFSGEKPLYHYRLLGYGSGSWWLGCHEISRFTCILSWGKINLLIKKRL